MSLAAMEPERSYMRAHEVQGSYVNQSEYFVGCDL